ncbi:MAG: general secretion pathway protein GspK [Spirochaetes bacterium]|nr:MAG: general secretion pathway protein GspK [Spirochaetota bacterium]
MTMMKYSMKIRGLMARYASAFRHDYARRAADLRAHGVFVRMRGSRGFVLVIVFLMITLLVSVSSEFFITAVTNMHYKRGFDQKLKAWTLAKAGTALCAYILDADKKGGSSSIMQGASSNSAVDSYQDLWALNFPEIPLEYGDLKLRINDENSKINLSVLGTEVVDRTPYYSITQRFFLNMGLPMDLADCLLDWVDLDDSRSPYGAESSDYYLTLPSPYHAKNREMDSIQEMLLVRGITPEIYYGLGDPPVNETNLVDDNRGNQNLDAAAVEKFAPGNKGLAEKTMSFKGLERPIGKERSRRLSDYFRVHGDRTDYLSDLNKININTASYRVLSALTDTMTDDIVTELVRRRQQKPFETVDEIKDLVPDDTFRKNHLSVRSFIFRIDSTGTVNDTEVTIVAVYNRDTKKYYYVGEQ